MPPTIEFAQMTVTSLLLLFLLFWFIPLLRDFVLFCFTRLLSVFSAELPYDEGRTRPLALLHVNRSGLHNEVRTVGEADEHKVTRIMYDSVCCKL